MKEDQLAALGGLLEGGGFGDGTQVLCRVCDVTIDTETGEPLEPVTRANLESVRQYLTEAGQAEEGGVALDAPSIFG